MKKKTKEVETTEQTMQATRGAPPKKDDEKKASDGLTNQQQKELKRIAAEFDPPLSYGAIKRMAVNWFINARQMDRVAAIVNDELEKLENEEDDENII